MKKIILFVFLSAVCFSCTKEADCDPVQPNDSDQIAISAEIINADIHSRTSYTVSITRTALTISTPTITDWTAVSGGNVNPGI